MRSAAKRSFFLSKYLEVKEIGQITASEAGRKGGLALFSKRGKKHFAEIGKKGQEIMKKRYPRMASEWGKKGGRPRKNNL